MMEEKETSVLTENCEKNRNAGFSLVELLVAMMITMIIITTVGQFMAMSSRNYEIVNNQVDLQMEAQCTINMISDMILEGNNVVFDSSHKMLRIYKNLGSTDSTGTPVDYRTAKQNIIWFDKSNKKLFLFVCENASDYTKAYNHEDGKLMAEGIDSFNVTCPTATDLSVGLSAGRSMAQQHCITVAIKLKTKATASGSEDDFTYEAVDTVAPRNEIVEL